MIESNTEKENNNKDNEQVIDFNEALNMFGGGNFDHDDDYYDDMDAAG